MKKVVLTSIILFLLSATLLAQDILKGKVFDKSTNTALPGANVLLAGKGTVTDNNGSFTIACENDAELIVSFVGYEIARQTIADCQAEIIIALNPSSHFLREVEITASSEFNRSILSQPATINKLGLTEIKRSTGLFLDDAINANVPGVSMQRRSISGGQQINIRGYGGGGPGPRGINSNFDQQGIKAYLNGIPITDAEGITLMDDIDFGSIGNVEILKGPAGSLYGLAIAGVVNLQRLQATPGRVTVGQEIMMGSYGLGRFNTNIQVGGQKGSLLINYGSQHYKGFMEHTASDKTFVNVMGDYKPSDKQSVTTYFSYNNSYDERNGELTIDQYNNLDYSGNQAYIKNDAHSNVISFRAGLGHAYQFSESISNQTSVFGTGINSNASSAGGWTDKAPVNAGLRSVFDTKFSLNQHLKLSGVTGVEMQKQLAQVIAYSMTTNNSDPNGYNIIGAMRSNQTQITGTNSLFTQWTLSMPHNISLTAGLGLSSMNIEIQDKLYIDANNVADPTVPRLYKTSYNNLTSPRVALNKIVNKQVSVYASYSVGYKAPVASNIYTPLAGRANIDLMPEKGMQFEIGTKGTILNDKLLYELVYFNSKFSNKMTLVGVPNTEGTATLYSYVVNSGSLLNEGVEAMFKYNAISSNTGFTKLLRPFVNFTYSDFVYNDFTFQNNISVPPADYSGKAVAGVPPVVFNGGVDFVSNTGLYANMIYMYRDKMPLTPDGLNIANSYSLLNAKVGYHKNFGKHFDADAYFGVNNMLSEQYYQMVFVNQLPDAFIPGPNNINYFSGINVKYIF
ncbi:TonB-dependent receptor [Chryseotalea sanaruensis]|uniref:TonB-dependent receptor n=1 Tax=Chryseotalea sanaruensis TaxID=2482724 RepID=A0A401UCW7_9BACT|nr:TonB-dependent receptor [Chryseotalea sanaruensis]GCC52745.1 TonB-dependent receptor [Chryseotalea sanaruensis]